MCAYGGSRVVCVPSLQLRPLQHQYEKYLQLFEPVGPELSLAFTNTAFANFIQSAMESSTVQQTIHNFVLLPREVLTWTAHSPLTPGTQVHHTLVYSDPLTLPSSTSQDSSPSSSSSVHSLPHPMKTRNHSPLSLKVLHRGPRFTLLLLWLRALHLAHRPTQWERQWGDSGREWGREWGDSGETVGDGGGNSEETVVEIVGRGDGEETMRR